MNTLVVEMSIMGYQTRVEKTVAMIGLANHGNFKKPANCNIHVKRNIGKILKSDRSNPAEVVFEIFEQV